MKIFVGNHTEERPAFVIDTILKFIEQCFKMKEIYSMTMKT